MTLTDRQVAVWLMTRSGYASTISPGMTSDLPDFAAKIFSAMVCPICWKHEFSTQTAMALGLTRHSNAASLLRRKYPSALRSAYLLRGLRRDTFLHASGPS